MEDFGVHNYNQQISNDSNPSSMEERSYINPMSTFVPNATAPGTSPMPLSNSNAPIPPIIAANNRGPGRGRPHGSKNKPKEKDPFFLTIPPRYDVIKEVRNFASKKQLVVTILCGSGMISSFSLRNLFPHGTPVRTDEGFFNLLSLTGTVSAASPSTSLTTSSCSIAISVAGLHGNVFGGIIEETFIAETEVILTVVTSRQTTNYRLPVLDDMEEET